MINGHGDDIYGYDEKIVSNFSSNVYNPMNNSSSISEHLASKLMLIHSYPEPDARSLAALLSEYHSIEQNNVSVTNGATEAIYLIAQLFKDCNTEILIPTFSEYEDACRIHNHNLQFVKSIDEVSDDTQVFWFCNPNNPTGKVTDKPFVINFIQNHPEMTIVIDQSYGFFTRKELLSATEAAQYPNVILLHSMTKRYAIPGIRLGYITAHHKIINKISALRMPWSVNGLAIETGKYLLKNDLSKHICINSYLDETKRLGNELNKINGLETFPTDTHFFLCRFNKHTATDFKSYLAINHGILIRDASNFRGLDQHYFRIATQSETENKRLVKITKEWMLIS